VFFYKHELTKSATNKMVLDFHYINLCEIILVVFKVCAFPPEANSFCIALAPTQIDLCHKQQAAC